MDLTICMGSRPLVDSLVAQISVQSEKQIDCFSSWILTMGDDYENLRTRVYGSEGTSAGKGHQASYDKLPRTS